MKFEVDLSADKVTAELSLAEFQEILDTLQAVKGKAPAPEPEFKTIPMFRLMVRSESEPSKFYKTRIWFDITGMMHGDCECGDNTFRRNWCKHLREANDTRLARAASLS